MRGRLLWEMSRTCRWRLMAGGVLGVVAVGCGVGLMASAAYLLSRAALHPSVAVLQVAIVGVRFFGITRAAARYGERLLGHDVTFRLLARLRGWLYEVLEPLAPARLQAWRSGELVRRAVGDVDVLHGLFVRVGEPAFVGAASAAAVVVLLGRWDMRAGVVLLGGLAVAGLGAPLLTRRAARSLGRRIARARGELEAQVVDFTQGLAQIMVLDGCGMMRRRIAACSARLEALVEEESRIQALHEAAFHTVRGCTLAAMLVWAIPALSDGVLEGVYLGVVALGALAAFEAVAALPDAWQGWAQSRAALHRLEGLSRMQPTAPSGGRAPAFLRGRPPLELERVSFAYQECGPRVLDGIDLTVPQGACVAVVGPSGAGKSTLVGLLARFWDCTAGEIRLYGLPLRELDPEAVRKRLGVMSQSVHLFTGTVRENLLLARPQADTHAVEQACDQAGLGPWLETLPEGLDTWIGEAGRQISSGQRQRLALARLLLQQKELVVLDEPTAHLDPVTEQDVFRTLAGVLKGRTALIITHRLCALDFADVIHVLDQGRLVESGSHEQLVRRKAGLYRRMWEMELNRRVVEVLDAPVRGSTFSS